ncbi:hypothetical protein VDS42_22575 [Xanthomonas campestris pv. campestris]|nr:hypothetical protein [Xanthomonas campestris pv. campestris]
MGLRQFALIFFAIGCCTSLAHANDLGIQVDVSENGTELYGATVHAAVGQQTRLRVGSDEHYERRSPVPLDAVLDGVIIAVTPIDVMLPPSIAAKTVDGGVVLNTQVQIVKLLRMKTVVVDGISTEQPDIDQWRISEARYLRPGESQSLSQNVGGKTYEVRLTPKLIGGQTSL